MSSLRISIYQSVGGRGEGGGGTRLSCLVRGLPSPSVEFWRDGQVLGPGRVLVASQGGGSRHSVLVSPGPLHYSPLYCSVQVGGGQAEYGNYSCLARNRLGTTTASLMVTGIVRDIREL